VLREVDDSGGHGKGQVTQESVPEIEGRTVSFKLEGCDVHGCSATNLLCDLGKVTSSLGICFLFYFRVN
jgi:hypothetical protein